MYNTTVRFLATEQLSCSLCSNSGKVGDQKDETQPVYNTTVRSEACQPLVSDQIPSLSSHHGAL